MTPSQRRAWLYGFLVVSVALAGWALTRGVPAWRQMAQLEREQAELRAQAQQATQRPGVSLVALDDELARLETRRQGLLEAEAPQASAAQLDATLARLAETHGLLVEATEARQPGARRVAPTRGIDDEGYTVHRQAPGTRSRAAVGRRVALRGSFGDLRGFLVALAELPTPPVVSRLAVARPDDDVAQRHGGLAIELEIAQ